MNCQNRICLTLMIATLIAATGQGALLVNDHFDAAPFVDGVLVGQNSWAQTGAASSSPLKVSGGLVSLAPTGPLADDQDCIRTFPTVPATPGTQLVIGFSLTVYKAPTINVSSYFFAADDASTSHFDNLRFAVIESSNSTFRLNARGTGQISSPFVAGSDLPYGKTLQVIGVWDFVAGTNNDTWKVYVDPVQSSQLLNPLYVSGALSGLANDPTAGFDGVVISQFTSGLSPSGTLKIGAVVAGQSFAEVQLALPEPVTIGPLFFGLGMLLNSRAGGKRKRN